MSSSEDFRSKNEYLRARYGISGSPKKRWVPIAIVIGLLGGSWLAWSSIHYSRPEIRTTLISFESLSDTKISIRYSLQFRDDSKPHTCLLTAKDYQANIVGQLRDEIPAGTTEATREVFIPTRLRAVNAGIEKCF